MFNPNEFAYLFSNRAPNVPNDARMVMVDGGIIAMGFYSENEREITLERGAIVKRWGAGNDITRGLGAFAGGPTEFVDADPVFGAIHIPKVREMLSIKIDAEAWKEKLLPPPNPVSTDLDIRIVLMEGGIVHLGYYSETYSGIYMRSGVVLRLWGVDTDTPKGLGALYDGPLPETQLDFNHAVLSHPFSRKLLDLPVNPDAWVKHLPVYSRNMNDFWA